MTERYDATARHPPGTAPERETRRAYYWRCVRAVAYVVWRWREYAYAAYDAAHDELYAADTRRRCAHPHERRDYFEDGMHYVCGSCGAVNPADAASL